MSLGISGNQPSFPQGAPSNTPSPQFDPTAQAQSFQQTNGGSSTIAYEKRALTIQTVDPELLIKQAQEKLAQTQQA